MVMVGVGQHAAIYCGAAARLMPGVCMRLCPEVSRATALNTMRAAAQATHELGPVGPAGQPLNWLACIHG